MASITLTLEEYEGLKEKYRTAENEAAWLTNELARARTEDGSGQVAPLVVLVRNALDVVSFAVANLPPETTKNWPVEAIRMVSVLTAKLPDHTERDASFALELSGFADECDRIDRMRRGLGISDTD